MAQRSDDGYTLQFPDKDALVAAARSASIGLIVVDPFVKSHLLEENSNPDMDAAATAWAEVGDATGAAILLVAFGVPRQELWIDGWRGRLEPPVCLGVGGLFDFYSGRIPRAPLWMREIGLEWVWRLLQEPRRMWRRYVIGNPLFLFRVWRQARHPERYPLAIRQGGGETGPAASGDTA